ncbi:MAG: flippase [Clostridia bacterium]|nr:flippase [Clostridia bacterium]
MGNKKIFKNYIYNLMYQVLVIILPIITTPYLSRVLGAENIGVYGYTISIVTYFTLLGALGINKYGQREIAYVQNDIDKRSKVFWELNIIKSCTIFISTIVFFFTFCIKGEYTMYYKILILELIATLLDITWFFQGIENFKKVVIRNLIIKVISVVLIFVFIKSPNDLMKYFCIYVCSNFWGNGIFWVGIGRFVKKVKINFRDLKAHIKPLISLFIPQIAVSIYTVLDKTMIGILSDEIVEVGYYEQSQKIIKIALTLVTTMSIVMLPRISNVFAQGKQEELNEYMRKTFKFDFFLSFPIMFGIMATAPNMVPWFFGEGYDKIINLLIMGSPIVLFISLSSTIGTQYLVSIKKQNIQTYAVVSGAVINFVLNFLLIPKFNSLGAIIATITAELIITLIEMIYIVKNKIINIKYFIKDMHKYVISSIIMFVSIYLITKFLSTGIICTLIQVIIGIIVYIALLLILKDEFLINTLKSVFNRKKV